ncbi:hypothetical protein EW146_g7714 [Bondarzewia mesenterica]|uniref:Mannosyltransferase n=1 Tax=Bondarzewia mesenterica TaxID=1095465 RepID=A0A4S4LQM6_9AGAM|nr:hypothetical protein EW146_g7714 [Bondarzewia mesenterica]
MGFTLDLLILATGWMHVLLAPYTKVEESFNLHATHDVLIYGYDHVEFSGAVPRTFLGSIFLALLSSPIIKAAQSFGFVTSKFDLQLIIRLVLSTLNAITLCLLRRAVSRRFGHPTSFAFSLLTCTQFHLPFWMGRTLPNMFALIPEFHTPITAEVQIAIALLTFASVVFRSEIALLLGCVSLQSLLSRQITFGKLTKVGLISGLSSVALTVVVDSYFWNQWPLWPELAGLYFNVFQGKSADWGVSPFHTYFASSIPKLLLGSAPLSLLGFLLDSRVRTLLYPAFLFIILISFLGHKEWRFIVYVIPLFNVAAACGARWMASRRKGSMFGRLMLLVLGGVIGANVFVTTLHMRASMANYPGGEALMLFNDEFRDVSNVHVHLSNLAAQTGASLFLQTRSPPYCLPDLNAASSLWIYNKTEHMTPQSLTSNRAITHLIAEARDPFERDGWVVADVVSGFAGWAVEKDLRSLVKREGVRGLLGILKMRRANKLWILERGR